MIFMQHLNTYHKLFSVEANKIIIITTSVNRLVKSRVICYWFFFGLCFYINVWIRFIIYFIINYVFFLCSFICYVSHDDFHFRKSFFYAKFYYTFNMILDEGNLFNFFFSYSKNITFLPYENIKTMWRLLTFVTNIFLFRLFEKKIEI